MDRRTFQRTLALMGLGIGPTLLSSGAADNKDSSWLASSIHDKALPPVGFDKLCYRIDGMPAYLCSGEFHYFRVPKADWRKRMEIFKEAGGNCLATYIPWLLHEPSEGKIIFGGEDGVRDLEGFLRMAGEAGLYVIARPGPYQYSELKYDGLPGWLCEDYPELRAQNFEGKPFRTSSVSYIHPLFLEKVRTWYSQVCPIIAKYTVSKGGPIAFVQLDNEMVGIHVWFGSLDYHAASMGFGKPGGRYPRFLRQRYGDVATLNRTYGTSFADFAAVRPLPPSSSSQPSEIRRVKDYFDFYLGTIAEYAQILAGMIREHGIDVPLLHNSAGPPMNALFCETVAALGNSFLLGSDHYYNLDQSWPQNNPTPQYALNAFCSMEMLRLMGFPPTILELPSGSASDWPPTTASDCKACYWTNLALGMKGNNYYIFTGGPNPPDAGSTTDLYDYGAGIGARNEVRPLYHVQKEFGLFLKARPWLVEAEREYDCRFALDFEYARADNYWKSRGEFLLSSSDAWSFFLKGPLTTAFCASLSPTFCDLCSDTWISDQGAPLVVVSSSSMASLKQERVVRFLKQGGKVLIMPVLPVVDENLQPCTTLRDFLGKPSVQINPNEFPRATVENVPNILDNGDTYFCENLPLESEVLGKDERTGRVIAWLHKTEGGGQVIFLGFRWVHAMHEHARMLKALLLRLGLEQKVVCSNPDVWTSLRTRGDKSTLFLMNLLSSPMEAEISCRPGRSGRTHDLGLQKLEPMSVKYVEL